MKLLKSSIQVLTKSIRYNSSQSLDLYRVLGVKRDANNKEIKDAFYKLSKLYHPDVTSDKAANDKFQNVAKAYEILGNATSKEFYDKGLTKKSTLKHTHPATAQDWSNYKDTSDNTSYSNFYVNNYNRRINEAWRKRSDPESMRTAIDYKSDQRVFIFVVVNSLMLSMLLIFKYHQLKEDPKQVMLGSSR